MTWVFIIAVFAVAGAFYAYGRRKHQRQSGLTSFQRHIDALSPERRRESFDRVRSQTRDDDQWGRR